MDFKDNLRSPFGNHLVQLHQCDKLRIHTLQLVFEFQSIVVSSFLELCTQMEFESIRWPGNFRLLECILTKLLQIS